MWSCCYLVNGIVVILLGLVWQVEQKSGVACYFLSHGVFSQHCLMLFHLDNTHTILTVIFQVNLAQPVAHWVSNLHSFLSWATLQDRPKLFVPMWYFWLYPPTHINCHPNGFWSRSFYGPDALPVTQPTASNYWRHKHWRHRVQIRYSNW